MADEAVREAWAPEHDHVAARLGLEPWDCLLHWPRVEHGVVPVHRGEACREHDLWEGVDEVGHRAVAGRPRLSHLLVGAAPDGNQADLSDHLEVGLVTDAAVVHAAGDLAARGGEPVERNGHVQDQSPLRLAAHVINRQDACVRGRREVSWWSPIDGMTAYVQVDRPSRRNSSLNLGLAQAAHVLRLMAAVTRCAAT